MPSPTLYRVRSPAHKADTGGLGVGPAASADEALNDRGVWLWRATGLGDGAVHAYNDAGQSPSPFGGVAVNVLANDYIGGVRADLPP